MALSDAAIRAAKAVADEFIEKRSEPGRRNCSDAGFNR